MKKNILKINAGSKAKMARFYKIDKTDACYEKAQELMQSNDGCAIKDFIDENFDDVNVQEFINGLGEDGATCVRVEDESGECLFNDEAYKKVTQSAFVVSDPRKWEFDESLGGVLESQIKKLIEENHDIINEAITQWKADFPDRDFDGSFGENYLCDFACDFTSLIVQAPFAEAAGGINSCCFADEEKKPESIYAVMTADLYDVSMECNIEIPDGEEFDPDKLHLMLNDYDGYYQFCCDAVLPVVMYGNKIYRLWEESWETHHEYFGFAKKEEGASYLEFFGGDFS